MNGLLLQFTACGLIFDAIGVLLLGFAFFFKTKESISQEAGTYFNSNPYVLRSIVASKFDGMTGTALLFIGFVLQVFGYAGWENEVVLVFSYLVLVVFVFTYFAVLRKKSIDSWILELPKRPESE